MDLLICVACGQQFGVMQSDQLKDRCFICDDERQFVPAKGQTWTTLQEMQGQYHNVMTETLPGKLWSIVTEPKFAIGQRAIYCVEDKILWDCLALIDDDTIEWFKAKGGIKAICISHPHYYTTCVEWARAFECPVYVFAEDRQWVCRTSSIYKFCESTSFHHHVEVSKDLVFVRVGGHFEGSAVLLSRKDKYLLIADTLSITPGNRRITIMWSYPNMIPLDTVTVKSVCWPRLARLDFTSMYSKFLGEEITSDAKQKTHESLKFYCHKLGGELE